MMTAEETKAKVASRAANPNLISVLLWLTLMTTLVGEIAFDRAVENAGWINLLLIGGLVGDVAKIVASKLGGV